MLLKALGVTPAPATGTVFADVPAGLWYSNAVEELYARGLTGGCTTQPLSFCPMKAVNRAEMSVFLLKANGITPPPATGTSFTDVPQTYWAAPWIEELARQGITAGCGDMIYCPLNPVTRAQMAVFMVRAFKLPLP
jgi:hypothetical protein